MTNTKRTAGLAALLAILASIAGCAASPEPGATAMRGAPPVATAANAPVEEVPYVKTPQPVVDAILDLAGLRSGDRLIDLGSGDGRIVISAARRFGAAALGVEIDPRLVELSRRLAREAGVAEKAGFVQQDLFETDLAGASVVTMYLLPAVNLALRPRLLATLAPGTRIVSHDWDLGDWTPDRSVTVPAPDKPVGREKLSRLHLWIVPARIEGAWSGRVDRQPQPGATGRDDTARSAAARADSGSDSRIESRVALELHVTQRFQQVDAMLRIGHAAPRAVLGHLNGERLTLASADPGVPVALVARVAGERVEGEIEVDGAKHRFVAVRSR